MRLSYNGTMTLLRPLIFQKTLTYVEKKIYILVSIVGKHSMRVHRCLPTS